MKLNSILFIYIILLICNKSSAQVNLSNGLMAYYPFNGSANDVSGNNNNGVVNGATLATGQLGIPNTAYQFNGFSDFIQVANSSTLNFPNDSFTIYALVKPQGFYSGACHGNEIIGKGSDFQVGWYTLRFSDAYSSSFLNCSSPVNMLQQSFSSQRYNMNITGPVVPPYILLNNWYCVTAISDGNTLKTYVDDSLILTQNITGTLGINANDLFIGRNNSLSFPYWFNGVMDEIRIYNRALNIQEIDSLCNISYVPPPCTTDTLVINSGYDPVAGTAIAIGIDPKWTVSQISTLASQGGSIVPPYYAYYLNPAACCQTVPTVNSNYAWIRHTPQGTSVPTNIASPYWTVFSRQFELCHSDSVTFILNAASDNWFTDFQLDSAITLIPNQPTGVVNANYYLPATSITQTLYLSAGKHTISVKVWNESSTVVYPDNPTGILVRGPLVSQNNYLIAENIAPNFNIDISTGYNPSTNTVASVIDPQWNVTNLSVCNSTLAGNPILPMPALLIPPNNPVMAFIADPSKHAYIDFSTQHFATTATCTYTSTFERNFTTPTSDSVDIYARITCDNWFTNFMLDGTLLTPSQTLGTNNYAPGVIVNKRIYLAAGNHTLSVVNNNLAMNSGSNWTGLLIEGYVKSVLPPCPCIVQNNLTANFGIDTTLVICNAATYHFTDSSIATNTQIATWHWNFGDGDSSNIQSPNHTYTTAGNYAVTLSITDTAGVSSFIIKNIVVSFNNPNFITCSGNSPICSGGVSNLNAQGGISYSWSPSTGLSNSSISNPSANPTLTTTYTVTGTDANGCSATSSVTITVDQIPIITATANPQSVCTGSATSLSGGGGNSYTWSGGITNATSFTPASTNTYTVTGTTSGGCTNTTAILVIVNPLPSVTATTSPTSVCLGSPVTPNANSAANYLWSNSLINNIPFVPSSSTTYTVTGTDANGCSKTATTSVIVLQLPNVLASAIPNSVCIGNATIFNSSGASTYSWSNGVQNGVPFTPTSTSTYTVTGNDANGCSKTASVTVTVTNGLNINVNPANPNLCIGDSILLNVTGAINYTWSPIISISNPNQASVFIYPTATTIYTVLGKDASGCTGTTQISVIVDQYPKLILSKSADVECANRAVQLNASGAQQYAWMPANLVSNPNSSNTIANINTTTTFTITGTNGACSKNDSITVNFFNNDEQSIFIPSAFSPNKDLKNDCLIIKQKSKFKSFYFSIYNRWGHRVFETADASTCWDGYFNSLPAEVGSYYYFLKAETSCGKIFKKGDVTLVR
jgi:gliding motility-associated-like protein